MTTPHGRFLVWTPAFDLLGPHHAELQHYSFRYNYQPADRFWTFEALFALALVIVGAVFVVAVVQLLRRQGRPTCFPSNDRLACHLTTPITCPVTAPCGLPEVPLPET